DDVAAGEGIPRQAQGAARPFDGECRQCRQEVSRGGAQDALRRDRAPLDLRGGFARGRQGAARGGDRISSAPGAARRAELAVLVIPGRPEGPSPESITTGGGASRNGGCS